MKLIGKVKIGNFMGKGWPEVEKLILSEGFPAERVDGRWEADSELITTWRLNRPKAPKQHNFGRG